MKRSDGRNGKAGPAGGRGKVRRFAKSGRFVSNSAGKSASRSSAGVRVSRSEAQSALHQVVYGHATGEALRTVRLREGAEIVAHVKDWAGGFKEAGAWYRSQPIPALGERTAEAVVMSGQAALVREYLDHLSQGGHA